MSTSFPTSRSSVGPMTSSFALEVLWMISTFTFCSLSESLSNRKRLALPVVLRPFVPFDMMLGWHPAAGEVEAQYLLVVQASVPMVS